jgi:hypothetical protein
MDIEDSNAGAKSLFATKNSHLRTAMSTILSTIGKLKTTSSSVLIEPGAEVSYTSVAH